MDITNHVQLECEVINMEKGQKYTAEEKKELAKRLSVPVKLGKLQLGVEVPEKDFGAIPTNPEWERVLSQFHESDVQGATIPVARGDMQSAISGLRNYAKKHFPDISIVQRGDKIFFQKVLKGATEVSTTV